VLYSADLSGFESVRNVTASIQEREGTPDIIMNNAGAGQWKYLQDTSPDEAFAMMSVPYLSAFAVTHAFIPALIQRKRGMIVNITSAASYMVWPGAIGYIAARWAMRGFNDALRAELNPHGITVMLVAFAKVSSEYWENNPGSEANVPKRQSVIPQLSPEQAAKYIVTGIERDKQTIMEPWQLRSIVAMAKFFPKMVK